MAFDLSKSLPNKISVLSFICIFFLVFPWSFIAEAATENNPVELSTQEYKKLKVSGPTTLHAIRTDSLYVNGSLSFIQVVVNQKAEVLGPCSGVDGEFSDLDIHGPFDGTTIKTGNLTVNGPTAIEDFKITGNVNINGPLKAKVGSFMDISSVQTPIALYDVTVDNIHVKKDSGWVRADNPLSEGYGQNNEIKLAGKTIVYGDITFESGNGVVFLRDKTAQFKGKVIGGVVKEQN